MSTNEETLQGAIKIAKTAAHLMGLVVLLAIAMLVSNAVQSCNKCPPCTAEQLP